MGTNSLHRRDLKRIVVAAMLVGMLVVSGAAGLIGWATSTVDRMEVTKERTLVERRLTRMLDGLVEDVNSASIWDDSVVALSGKPDLEWLQLNFGDYYADYMDHAVTLTYDGSGRLIAASRDSDVVPVPQEAPFAAAVAPMVAEVRAESQTAPKRRALGFEAVVNRKAVVRVGNETWLVAASSVVPELASVARPASDPVVVSAQPISVLVASMRDDLLILDPHFSAAAVEGAASVVLGGTKVSRSVLWPGLPPVRDAGCCLIL